MPPMNGISEGKYRYKAGKLIVVNATFDCDTILKIKITGDFFLHPEERIEEIEEHLTRKKIGEIEALLERDFKDAEYEGISAESLAHAIREAWKRRA